MVLTCASIVRELCDMVHLSTANCFAQGPCPIPCKPPLICACVSFISTPSMYDHIMPTCSVTLTIHNMTASIMHTAILFSQNGLNSVSHNIWYYSEVLAAIRPPASPRALVSELGDPPSPYWLDLQG